MHSAMQKALRRYPYFVFRIIKTDSGYDKVENQLPVVVMDSFDKEIVLGSEEVNYHWIAAACEGKELKLIMSFMIADGRSAMRFYKTLLYCYFTEKTGNRLDPYGILLPDSGISPDEDVKVYGIMDGEDNTRRNTVEDPFMIPDAVEDPMKAYFYFLCRVVSFGEKHLTRDEIDSFHLSTLRLTYNEAVCEYEKRRETKLGRLVANRELPILRKAWEIMNR